jgi:hypothetical protein
MKPMRFENIPAWESVTRAIYNPAGINGQHFWQKLEAYKVGDEKQIENGF